MSVRYVIVEDAGIVLLTLRGDVDSGERLAVIKATMSDRAFRSGIHVLEDHRESRTVDDVEAVKQLMLTLSRSREVLHRTKWAILESTPAGYGMANLTSVLAEDSGVSMRGFLSIEEACTWLREGDRSDHV